MAFLYKGNDANGIKSKVKAAALTALLAATALVGLGYTATNVGATAAFGSPATYGDLDTSFGTGGQVLTDMNSELDEPHGIVIQPDGKIVAAGVAWPGSSPNFALARYNANGTLDSGFGTGGKVFTDFGRDATANAVVLQPDGKIVVGGEGYFEGVFHETFVLARYNTDGSLDSSFGTDGLVTTNVADATEENGINGLALTPDNKIVAVGAVGNYFLTQDFAVARYNTDGSLDTSFGTNGSFTYDSGVGGDKAVSAAVLSDNKIIVGGNISEGSGNDDFGAVRLNANGTLDTSFGTGGVVYTDFLGGTDWAYGIAPLPNGGVLLGGLTQIACPSSCERYGFGLAQYTANGSLDASFGDSGTATYDLISSAAAYAMVRRSDGTIVLGGHKGNDEFIVGLIQPNGVPVSSFGDEGFATTDFSAGADRIYALASQSDGKIVAGGRAVNPADLGDSDFGLARFQAPPIGGSNPTATPTHTGNPTATSTSPAGSTATPTTPAGTTATATSIPGDGCAIPFSDVPVGSTFYTYVHCLSCQQVLGGYSDGTFRPNNNITRGQLSKIVSNAAGYNDTPTGQTFSDVAPGSTFYDYVERMASRGIIGGYSDGTFRPNNNATRGQIAKIAANAAGFEEEVTGQTFSDVAPGSTFYDYVERMASRGIIGGYSDGTFRPNNAATRGQTAKITSNTFFPDCDAHAK